MNTFMTRYTYHLITLFTLLVLGSLFFVRTLGLGFFSDDYHIISVMMNGPAWWHYFFTNIIGEVGGGTYGPLYNTLIAGELVLFGTHAIFFHVVSLVAYMAISYVLYLITYRFTHEWVIGFVAALYYLLMHSHVSSVAWVSVQPHLFATLCFMLAWYAYSCFVSQKKWWQYVLSLLCIMMSFVFKESALMFVGLLFFYEIFLLIEKKRVAWKSIGFSVARVIPFVGITVVYLFIRYRIVGYVAGYYGDTSISYNVIQKVSRLIDYTIDMVVAAPYRDGMNTLYHDHSIVVWMCVIFFMIATWVLARTYRKKLIFLLSAYVVMSVPFLAVQLHPFNNGGERYTLLISIFFVMYMSMLIYDLVHTFRYRYIWYVGIMMAIIGSSVVQLVPKLHDWGISAQVRDTIIADIARAPMSDDSYLLVVGMPDNINGAENMRNAFFEMIAYEMAGTVIEGTRIPLYTEFTKMLPPGVRIVATTTESGIVLATHDHARIFTGFPVWEHDTATITLQQFIPEGNSGTAIEITKTDVNNESMTDIWVGYFDGHHMQFMPLE